jgi:RNA polymerase sigma factor (sigma-70 family)
MEEESLDNWFTREILVHERALLRYLTRIWPNPGDVVDLRQDTYVRVYEAAGKSRPQSPKSFLFTTARHLVADRFRRQRIVAIDAVADMDELNVMIEEICPERRLSGHQELRRLAYAIDLLPPKCREVVWMRRVDDLPQKEVAARLGVSQKTVEKHVMKGMQLLANAIGMGSGRVAGEEEPEGQKDGRSIGNHVEP